MNTIRRIRIATGSRAEYGLLRHLALRLSSDPLVELGVIVTGSHLEEAYGLSVVEIEADNLSITARVPLELGTDDSPRATTEALARCTAGFANEFARDRPDLLVVLGDRYEILGPVQAALLARIPVAHIHGGETTTGALDESIRHAVTKMSHLHFTAHPVYRQRVIQLGEDPRRVWMVGPMAIDGVRNAPTVTRDEMLTTCGFELDPDPIFAVTYHPMTTNPTASECEATAIVEALRNYPQAGVVITAPNADSGRATAAQIMEHYAREDPQRRKWFTNLGNRNYLSLIRHADVVVGNSSSGIIEAPLVGTPSIDIGERQAGRETARATIRVQGDTPEIIRAIDMAINQSHRNLSQQHKDRIDAPSPAEAVAEILTSWPLDGLIAKRFYAPEMTQIPIDGVQTSNRDSHSDGNES